MKLLKCKSILFLSVMICMSAYAQPSLLRMKQTIDNEELLQPKGRSIKLINSTQAGILFKNNTELQQSNAINWLSQKLALRQNEDQLVDENRDVLTVDNFVVKKIHQYYKGIKVEHGVINSTGRNGNIAMIQLEYYSVPNGFNTRAQLSEQQALDKAIAYTGAQAYAWGDGTDTTDEDRRKPKGELVIIQTYLNEEGVICLAYKYNIYAVKPLMRSYIYVNALDGTIVLDDPIIKHAKREYGSSSNEKRTGIVQKNENVSKARVSTIQPPTSLTDPINNAPATADTRFSGRKSIVTDLYSATDPKPYRLRELRNNHNIIALNYQQNDHQTGIIPSYESTSPDFTDNNNDWTAAEYHNTEMDDGAMDVMYNMEWVSDYWKNVHNRNSWNNSNGNVVSYVHVYENGAPYDNAYWNGKNMHFGDGNGVNGVDPIAASLDDCAHELGHGITGSTSGLVYRWESGALDESFSDIWAACITNYAKVHDATLSSEITWRLFEKSTNPNGPLPTGPGARDMKNPAIFNDPTTYHSQNWRIGDFVTCHKPSQNGSTNNDMCGVHHNSGVFNKWFYLITDGEAGTNTKGNAYNITGLGFGTSQKIAYLMELNLTPNAGYANAMTVSLNAAATLYGYGSTEFNTVKSAWAAVGVDTANTYNMTNTAVFTTNNFTGITVGKDGNVFAGTNYSGFYKFNGTDWSKLTELPDVRFNDIKTDKDGGIWIAQSGRTGTQGGGSSIGGGVNYLKYPYTANSTLYTVDPLLHVPSRNGRCMYIDTFRTNDGTNPKAWVATLAYITSNNSTSGMLGQGLFNATPEFAKVNAGINVTSGTVGCLTVGGNKKEIWTFVQANNGINQLLSYDAATNALLTTYDHNSEPSLPSGFAARAIYGDRYNRIWVGLASGGIMIFDENRHWHNVNFTPIFPPGMQVNYNAITGNRHGDIYIGTSMGMVYFDAGGGWANRLEDPLYYRLYGKANGLMSDNINAIAYDKDRFKLWVATDSGVVIWDPPCIGDGNCYTTPQSKNDFSVSKGNGNWSNPNVWDSGLIPDSSTIVVITDTITVDINAQCQSLGVINPGNLKINTGIDLKIFESNDIIKTHGEGNIRRRRR